jgi:hypothetical protein
MPYYFVLIYHINPQLKSFIPIAQICLEWQICRLVKRSVIGDSLQKTANLQYCFASDGKFVAWSSAASLVTGFTSTYDEQLKF